MTVCVAGLFQWNHAPAGRPPDFRLAAITASDRMFTSADVQYEPDKFKVGQLSELSIILIAGEITVHSQAIKETQNHFRGVSEPSIYNVATVYGREVQKIKLKEAEDLYLATLGLNSDTFIAQQRDLAPSFVSTVTDQMQGHRGDDVEAIIVGSHRGNVQIYAVDSRGIVTCCDDVGFAAIGIGAWHAKSFLMQSRFSSGFVFTNALAAIYAAKRAAEVAPGVGRVTDLHIVFRDAILHIPTAWPQIMETLEKLYNDVETARAGLVMDALQRLQTVITTPRTELSDEAQRALPGGDAQANAGISTATSETPRSDEAWPAKNGG